MRITTHIGGDAVELVREIEVLSGPAGLGGGGLLCRLRIREEGGGASAFLTWGEAVTMRDALNEMLEGR